MKITIRQLKQIIKEQAEGIAKTNNLVDENELMDMIHDYGETCAVVGNNRRVAIGRQWNLIVPAVLALYTKIKRLENAIAAEGAHRQWR